MHCDDYEGLSDLLRKDAASWGNFWAQGNAEEIVEMNTERFREEVDSTISSIIAGWEMGDAVMAGKAYGHFWDTLMT